MDYWLVYFQSAWWNDKAINIDWNHFSMIYSMLLKIWKQMMLKKNLQVLHLFYLYTPKDFIFPQILSPQVPLCSSSILLIWLIDLLARRLVIQLAHSFRKMWGLFHSDQKQHPNNMQKKASEKSWCWESSLGQCKRVIDEGSPIRIGVFFPISTLYIPIYIWSWP